MSSSYVKRELGLIVPKWVTDAGILTAEKLIAIAGILAQGYPDFVDAQGVWWQLVDVLPPYGGERPFVGVFCPVGQAEGERVAEEVMG